MTKETSDESKPASTPDRDVLKTKQPHPPTIQSKRPPKGGLPAFAVFGYSCDMISLQKPSLKLLPSYISFIEEMRAAGETIWEGMTRGEGESDHDFIDRLNISETAPPPNMVAQTNYWAWDGKQVVGRIALRHELNENLKKFGGHIGYEVRPSARGRGVAKEMLRLVLLTDEAQKLERVLLTCAPTNEASNRTILANGGALEKTAYVERIRRDTNYYWIKINKLIKRKAARAVLLTPQNEILLIKISDPSGTWTGWITPGGGIDEGETDSQSLARELKEELGYTQPFQSEKLWYRTTRFTWVNENYEQTETFYLIKTEKFEVSQTLELTDSEKAGFKAMKWWRLEDIAQSSDNFAPPRFYELVKNVVKVGAPPAPLNLDHSR